MLRIEVEVVGKMIEARTEVSPNPNTKVRVGRILDKLFVGIVISPSTSRRIEEIQRMKRIIP